MRTNSNAGTCPGGSRCTHKVTVHWNDKTRREQAARFGGLEPQSCDQEGIALRNQILGQVKLMPEHVRVDIPSARLIARVLGVYRTAATVKNNPMTVLELSAKEIAKIAGYCKTQVEAALRWLGVGEIVYRGEVVAMGLGIITRTMRKGKATMCGILRGVFRTSATELTKTGRHLLGIFPKPAANTKPFDKAVMKRDHKERRTTARRNALNTIADSVRSFWASLMPEAPPDFGDQDTSMTPLTREFLERARIAVEKRKAVA